MSTMRIGGLASGMDIDSLVEKLMTAERMPMDKLEQQKQIYEWQRDAYREVNTKMTTLDTYIADNYILKSLNTKTATSSNENLVSAVATGTASGSIMIEGVKQLAEAARGIGTQINATSNTKVSSLFTNGELMPTTFTLSAIDKQGALGSAVSIVIDANTTIDELIKKINGSNAGVTALFENGKLSLTAKNTGKEINGEDAMKKDENGTALFSKLGLTDLVSPETSGRNAIFIVNGIATERTTNSFSMNGYNITLKSTFNENKTQTELEKASQKSFEFAKSNLENILDSLMVTYNVTFNNSDTLEQKFAAVQAKLTSEIGSRESSLSSANIQLTNAKNTDVNGQTAGTLYNNLSEEGKAVFNNATRYDDLTPEQKLAFAADITADNFEALKEVHTSLKEVETATTNLNNVKAAEVSLTVINTNYINTKNELDDINNQTVPITPSVSPVTMSSSTNVDEIIGKIKEFVATYNGFIKDLTGKTKESKYNDFKPLTALHKKEMEESEITLWETKSKSGLLRNDAIITSGLSSLRSLVYETNYGVTNQKYNALYTIGIGTSKDYTSGGLLEIDETKLRAALQEDPDAVVQLLTMSGDKNATVQNSKGETITADTQGFMRKIRAEMDKIEKKIDERAGRGSMAETQYTLGKYLTNVNRRLDSWQDKLATIESRYWKQFGAMEAMINKANNQSAQLANQFY